MSQSENNQSVSVNVHHPEVEDVVYFPPTSDRPHFFARVRCEGKGTDLTLMFSTPEEAWALAEAIDKAGAFLNLAGYTSRQWTPSKREGK